MPYINYTKKINNLYFSTKGEQLENKIGMKE